MSDQLSRHCDDIYNSLKSAFSMSIHHGNFSKQQTTVKVINLAEKLSQVEALYSNEINAVNNTVFNNLKTFDNDAKKLLLDCKKSVSGQVRTCPRFQSLQAEIDGLVAAQSGMNANTTQANAMQETFIDDDIQMGTSDGFIDPITKLPIQNPYRNKFCNHVYDLKSISQSITDSKQRTRCPYVGCGNQTRLRLEDLIEDRDLRMKIMQKETDFAVGDSEDLFSD